MSLVSRCSRAGLVAALALVRSDGRFARRRHTAAQRVVQTVVVVVVRVKLEVVALLL